MVSESAAASLADRPAMGQELWLPDVDRAAWREVVGIVEDIQFRTVGERPGLHVSFHGHSFRRQAATARQGQRRPVAAAPLVRAGAQQMSIVSNIDQVATFDALVAVRPPAALHQPRGGDVRDAGARPGRGRHLRTLSFMVGTRREIGIRMALGASRERVLRTVVWRGLAPAAAGALTGGAAAVALARTFHALLFNVTSLDPVSLGGAVAVLLLVATVAALGPAAGAARTIRHSRCAPSSRKSLA